MNKKELIKAVAEKVEMSQKDVAVIVNLVFETFSTALSEGQDIKVAGFGAFKVKERAERKARNPQTQEEIVVPATKVVSFKPAKQLKDIVK